MGTSWHFCKNFCSRILLLPKYIFKKTFKNTFDIPTYFFFTIYIIFSLEWSCPQFLKDNIFYFEYPFCQFASTAQEVKSWWRLWLICGIREFSKLCRNGSLIMWMWGTSHTDFSLAIEKIKCRNYPVVQIKGSLLYPFIWAMTLKKKKIGAMAYLQFFSKYISKNIEL